MNLKKARVAMSNPGHGDKQMSDSNQGAKPSPRRNKPNNKQGGKGQRPGKRNTSGLRARQVAANLIQGVHGAFNGDGRPLDAVLEDASTGFTALDAQHDRALARAIASTAIRHKGEIEQELKSRLTGRLPHRAPVLKPILHAALAQILFMEVADHAAVSLAVDCAGADTDAKHFKPLVNGVLRSTLRDQANFKPDPSLNAPQWLREIWEQDFGVEKTKAIMAAQINEAALDITVKDNVAAWAKRLGGTVIGKSTVRLSKGIKGHTKVQELDGFADGEWWVQDAAAVVPAEVLLSGLAETRDIAGARVLDACAAPGGKTAQLAAAGAAVTALDVSSQRLVRLKENMTRLKLTVEVETADLLSYQPDELFDAILLDAPCSATGTIRRHPDVPWLKTRAQIKELVALQQSMLTKAATLLKPGGILVFCTCSLLKAEGEDHISGVLAELPLSIVPITPNEVALNAPLTVGEGIFRSTPDNDPVVDGFFAIRLKRN